jgi:hypothetical protein
VPVGRADIAVEASAEEKTNQVHVTVNLKNQSTTAAKQISFFMQMQTKQK